MPQAVWSHDTIVRRETNFMPFQLMYGAEAVLLEEEKHRSLRTTIGSICRQAQECCQFAEIPRRDKDMERLESQTMGIQCGQLGTFVKPAH
jgi:hypothetical protein